MIMDFLPQEHYPNRNRFPEEELDKYRGKYVAWSIDGTRIVASGDNDYHVYEAVKAAGLDPQAVVFSYVDGPDDVELGGALLLEEEGEPA
jgi:Family of unknown function (DUF5678)